MILFLIELYLLGCGIAVHFREKLPDLFLSIVAILLGFFAYFINLLILILLDVQISRLLVSV